MHAICRCVGMVDEADSKSVASDGVWVRVPPPAPRQNKAARSCGGTSTATSTGDLVFPFQPRPAEAGLASDWETGSDLDCSGAPRQNKAARSCGGTSTATSTGDLVFPFQPRPAEAGLASDCGTGSDFDCFGAPEL